MVVRVTARDRVIETEIPSHVGPARCRGGRAMTVGVASSAPAYRVGGHRGDARDADLDARTPDTHRGSNRSVPGRGRPRRSAVTRGIVGKRTLRDRRLADGTDVLLVSLPRPADPVAVDRARVIALPAEEGGLTGDWRSLVMGSCGSSHRRSLPARNIKPPAMLVGGPTGYTIDYGRNGGPAGGENGLRRGVCPAFAGSVVGRSNCPFCVTFQVNSLEWIRHYSVNCNDLTLIADTASEQVCTDLQWLLYSINHNDFHTDRRHIWRSGVH